METETRSSRTVHLGPSAWSGALIRLMLAATSGMVLIVSVLLAAILAGWALLAAALPAGGPAGEMPVARILALLLAAAGGSTPPGETPDGGGRLNPKALEGALRNWFQADHARQPLAAIPDASPRSVDRLDVQKNNLYLREPLSKREIEVLQMIAGGLTNKEIASRLFISVRTVKYHTTGVYTKLGVNGRVQATVSGRELGLLY